MKNFSFLILAVLFLSCGKQTENDYQLQDNAVELIAGTTDQTWKLARRFNNDTRMNMGDCFLHYRITYQADGTFFDNNGEASDCGASMHGKWQIVKSTSGTPYIQLTSPQIPELLSIDENFLRMKIQFLSADQLIVQFRHSQTTVHKSIITDIFVPENADIQDREFHW
ncbi:MAG: hypothetical protein WBA74_12375 [Cyclobacteriaceae bacterium]